MGAGAGILQFLAGKIIEKVSEADARSFRAPFEIIADRPILIRGGVLQTK